MALSKPARRVVAGIAGAFLLLCQTAAVAQACLPEPAVAGGSTAIAPCHGAAFQADDTAVDARRQDCPAQHACPTVIKVDLPGDLDNGAHEFRLGELAAAARIGRIAPAPPERAGSPSLTIFHCRLRN